MSRKTFLLALTGALFSFTSFNTTSYAMIKECGNYIPPITNKHIDSVEFSIDYGKFSIHLSGDADTVSYYNPIDTDALSAYIQPLEILAYLSGSPITFCSPNGDGKITKFEMEERSYPSMTNPNSPSHQTIKN